MTTGGARVCSSRAMRWAATFDCEYAPGGFQSGDAGVSGTSVGISAALLETWMIGSSPRHAPPAARCACRAG